MANDVSNTAEALSTTGRGGEGGGRIEDKLRWVVPSANMCFILHFHETRSDSGQRERLPWVIAAYHIYAPYDAPFDYISPIAATVATLTIRTSSRSTTVLVKIALLMGCIRLGTGP